MAKHRDTSSTLTPEQVTFFTDQLDGAPIGEWIDGVSDFGPVKLKKHVSRGMVFINIRQQRKGVYYLDGQRHEVPRVAEFSLNVSTRVLKEK